MSNSPFSGMLQGAGQPSPDDIKKMQEEEEQARTEQKRATAVHLAIESSQGGFGKTADLLSRADSIAHFISTGLKDK